MVQVTGVGIAVAVKGQVGPRDHFEGCAFRSQIVEIVEDPSQYRGAGLDAEDFGAVGLGVGMDHDSRMPRMGASVATGSADQCVAEKVAQKFDHLRVSEGLYGRGRVGPLNIGKRPLMRAVVNCLCRKLV